MHDPWQTSGENFSAVVWIWTRFVPLRLVAGKLQPPPPTAELPALVSVSRAEVLSQTPEERHAVMERLRAKYHAAQVELANSQP